MYVTERDDVIVDFNYRTIHLRKNLQGDCQIELRSKESRQAISLYRQLNQYREFRKCPYCFKNIVEKK